MVEVFKTNVNDPDQAAAVVSKIQLLFTHYEANFDLEDCDRILRVENKRGSVESNILIHLMENYGYSAEVLEEDEPFTSILNEQLN